MDTGHNKPMKLDGRPRPPQLIGRPLGSTNLQVQVVDVRSG